MTTSGALASVAACGLAGQAATVLQGYQPGSVDALAYRSDLCTTGA
jgi:hypothetical protein